MHAPLSQTNTEFTCRLPAGRPLHDAGPSDAVYRAPVIRGFLALAVGWTALVVATPAAAHPFGPPPRADVSADGPVVTVLWTAEPDELFALGSATGALAQRQVLVFQDGVQVPSGQQGDSIDEQLARAPEIRDYLGEHILVRQQAGDCQLTDVDTAELPSSGARLSYTCPEAADEVELEITALIDLDPAYRTVATGAGGARSLHTAAEPIQSLSLTAGDEQTSWLAPAIGLAVLAAGAAVFALWRRGRIRQ